MHLILNIYIYIYTYVCICLYLIAMAFESVIATGSKELHITYMVYNHLQFLAESGDCIQTHRLVLHHKQLNIHYRQKNKEKK